MEHTIFAQIRSEASDFFDGFISPVPGYSFNQYNTIKRCHLYKNSKYEDASTYLGRDKLFFNIVNPACEVATKMLDVNTDNIKLLPLNPKSYFSTYLLEKELKVWLKTSELSKTLNQIAEELPVYGSVVLEKTKKSAKVVDIRRLIMDPSVDCIEDSRFVTTVHYMTPSELRETGWDNVDVAIERFGSLNAQEPFEDQRGDVNQQVSTPYIKVYKRYGEVPKHWLDGGSSEKMVRALFIVAGADVLIKNTENKNIGEGGVILFKSKWHKDWPYKDFHYLKVKGRWLGLGVIEMLFDTQVRMNELKNQKRISMEISAMHLFSTPDKSIVRNALTDLRSGDILISPNGITAIANEERNLPAFKDEEESYGQHVDKLTFAYDAVRGESPPSSTPLGTTEIVTAQATSVFGFKRQNQTIALREFFNEFVMPQLLDDLTPEHIMCFTGSFQELQKMDEAAAELRANDYIKSQFLSGKNVTPEDVDEEKQKYINSLRKLGTTRFLKIKDAFYKNTEYEFDYNIDNENDNPQAIVQNLQKVIGDLASNPAIMQDPRLKLLYFKFAQRLGVNEAELDQADNDAQRMQAMQQLQAPQGQPEPVPTQ